jgi:hypothetical protein
MVSQSFQFLNITGELFLQKVETMADVPADFVGKAKDLHPRFLRNEESIGHNSLYLIGAGSTPNALQPAKTGARHKKPVQEHAI